MFSNFTEEEEQEDDYLRLKNFVISPSEFFLQKGESNEITVYFIPKTTGQIQETFSIVCDN